MAPVGLSIRMPLVVPLSISFLYDLTYPLLHSFFPPAAADDDEENTTPIPSFQPIGIRAAATSFTPRSVASMLYCEAALRVSSTSTRIPSALMACRVAGLSGRISGPTPMIKRSVGTYQYVLCPYQP